MKHSGNDKKSKDTKPKTAARSKQDKKLYNIKNDSFSREIYFPTMIFDIDCADHETLNEYLLKLVYEERKQDQKGIVRSNVRKLGGWHSQNNLHQKEAYKPLHDRIHQAGRRISSQLGYDPERHLKINNMWSIINPPGSFNKSHIHPNSHWSGVYYIHAPENAGRISFTDPRTAHIMSKPKLDPDKKSAQDMMTSISYKPTAGKMIIFPSWLYHSVAPNMSEKEGKDAERVIISFNLSQVRK